MVLGYPAGSNNQFCLRNGMILFSPYVDAIITSWLAPFLTEDVIHFGRGFKTLRNTATLVGVHRKHGTTQEFHMEKYRYTIGGCMEQYTTLHAVQDAGLR